MTQKRCVAEQLNNEIWGEPQPQMDRHVQAMNSAVTRRNFVRAAGLSGGLGALEAGMSALTTETLAQQGAVPLARTEIESITIKRRGVGFRGYDPDRAFPGFTLFTPLPTTNRTVYLIDMQGNVVHIWTMPYPPGQSGYLTERGTLFYNGQIPNASHVGQAPYKGGAALEMDWNGRVLWEVN